MTKSFLKISTFQDRPQQIYYNDIGSGEPVILLHNGFYSTCTWDGIRDRFSPHFRVLDYDRYGYGKSDHFTSEIVGKDVVEEGVKELELFVDKLELKNIRLVGHCLGGAIALIYAFRHPENVSRIAAISVGYFGSPRSIIQTDMTFASFESIDETLRKKLMEMHGKDYAQHFWAILSENRSSYIMSTSYDIRKEVKHIKCPILLVNGDRDFYFEPEHPVSVFKKIRRSAALWIVPNCGHDVHLEKTDDFVVNILKFLKAE